jgi:hypothetical protein
MDIRFVPATLDLSMVLIDGLDSEVFRKEYRMLGDFEEDAVGQWLKLARARGETQDSDEVLMRLLIELHKKVDVLTDLVKDEEKQLLKLPLDGRLCEIGFENIKLEEGFLDIGKEYYCRIHMPVFPIREMPMFLKAIKGDIAEIILIHEKDQKDWNSYVTARERSMIREMKSL